MTDKLIVDVDSPGVEESTKNFEQLSAAVRELGTVIQSTKGSTSALKELRQLLVGLKGKGSAFDELSSAIRGLGGASQELKNSFETGLAGLQAVVKSEMRELKSVMQNAGASVGRDFGRAVESGLQEADAGIKRQGKTLAATARAEATRVYEAMVAGQANARIKPDAMGDLFKLSEAGASLSPYHKKILSIWKKQNSELLAAATQEAENLQNALKAMEESDKLRNASLAGIYAASLNRGSQDIARVKSALKAEAKIIADTVKQEESVLQAALGAMEASSKERNKSLAAIYANSLARGSQDIARVQSNLKTEAKLIADTVKQEQAALQAALGAMEAREAGRVKSLAGIYAGSLARGSQDIERVKAKLRADAQQIIEAQKAEIQRIQQQVAAATNAATGAYQAYNANTGVAGRVVNARAGAGTETADAARQADAASNSLKRFTIDANDAHSAARGLASAFGLLWLTWGNLAPLFAGAGVSYSLKKAFDIGSEVEYQIAMMKALGQTVDETGKEFEGMGSIIRAELRNIDQETQFSLVELSQAMVRLGQAGKTPEEALNMLRPAANLASLGMVDLKTSIDLLIQTQALFNKTAADTGKIAAQIFQVTKSGVLNVEDIGNSMKYASEANTRFGKSVEETLTLLGALAQAGLKGSTGGTALINFYRDLNGRSGPAIKALKDLEKATQSQIRVFDEMGKQRSGIDIFNDIAEASRKLKAEDADKLLAKIFSDRGGRTFFAMIREGTLDLQKMVSELENVKPESLLESARGLMDTTKGAFDILKGTLVGVMDSVFEGFSDQFKSAIVDLTQVVDSGGFKQAVAGMVGGVLGLYEAIKTLSPALITFFSVWAGYKVLTTGIAIFQGAAAALAGLAPVLAMSTSAYVKKTFAVEANSAAMIQNVTAQRAAAAGMTQTAAAAQGAAAAQSAMAVTSGAAGLAMRGVSAAIAFLANPIVGLVTTLGLLGYAWYESSEAADKASGSTTGKILSDGKLNIEQWNREIQLLRTRANLLDQDAFTESEGKLALAQANMSKLVAEYDKTQERIAARARRGQAPETYKDLVEYGERQLNQIKKQQRDINQAYGDIDRERSDIAAKAQAKELERRKKQEAEAKRLQGTISVSTPKGGWGGERQEFLRLQNSNELKQIEARYKKQFEVEAAAFSQEKAMLATRYSANLLSASEYEQALTALAQEAEQKRAVTSASASKEYAEGLASRFDYMQKAFSEQIKKTAADNSLEGYIAGVEGFLNQGTEAYRAFTKEIAEGDPAAFNNLKNNLEASQSGIEAYISALQDFESAQPEGPVKKLAAEMLNAAQAALTFSGNLSGETIKDHAKKTEEARKAYDNLAKSIGDASKAAADFVAKDRAERDEAKRVDELAQKYRFLNDSVFSSDTATKAGETARYNTLKKYGSQLQQLQKNYKDVTAAVEEYGTKNKEAILAGNEEILKQFQLLTDAEAKIKKDLGNFQLEMDSAAAMDALNAFEAARREQINALSEELGDAMYTAIYEGGSAGGQKFIAILRRELLTKPLQALITGTISNVLGGSGLNNAMGGIFGGQGGGLGNLLGGSKDMFGGLFGSGPSSDAWGSFANTSSGASDWLMSKSTDLALNGFENLGDAAYGLGESLKGIDLGSVAAIGGALYSISQGKPGQGVGTALGSFLGGPIGAIAGGWLGGTIDDFFGGDKDNLFGGGYELGSGGRVSRTGGVEKTISDELSIQLAEAAVKQINDSLKKFGSSQTLANFWSGNQSSEQNDGGTFSGGQLSGGAKFGEQWTTDTYKQTISPEDVMKQYGRELKISSIEALKAADIPTALKSALGEIDLETATTETIDKALNALALIPEKFVQTIGMSTDKATGLFEEIASVKVPEASSVKVLVDGLTALPQDVLASADAASVELINSFKGVDFSKLGTEDLMALRNKLASLPQEVIALIGSQPLTVPDNFRLGEETTLETLGRLGSHLEEVNKVFERLGGEMLDTSLAGGQAAYEIAQAAGGIQAFGEQAASFYDKFYTEAEKNAVQVGALTKAFEEANVVMPKSQAEYKKAVQDAIALGAAGKNTLATLLKYGNEFASVMPQVTNVFEAISQGVSGSLENIVQGVLLGEVNAYDAGAKLGEAITSAIQGSLVSEASARISATFMSSIVDPMIVNLMAGKAAMDGIDLAAFVERTSAQARALKTALSDNGVSDAVREVATAFGELVGAAGGAAAAVSKVEFGGGTASATNLVNTAAQAAAGAAGVSSQQGAAAMQGSAFWNAGTFSVGGSGGNFGQDIFSGLKEFGIIAKGINKGLENFAYYQGVWQDENSGGVRYAYPNGALNITSLSQISNSIGAPEDIYDTFRGMLEGITTGRAKLEKARADEPVNTSTAEAIKAGYDKRLKDFEEGTGKAAREKIKPYLESVSAMETELARLETQYKELQAIDTDWAQSSAAVIAERIDTMKLEMMKIYRSDSDGQKIINEINAFISANEELYQVQKKAFAVDLIKDINAQIKELQKVELDESSLKGMKDALAKYVKDLTDLDEYTEEAQKAIDELSRLKLGKKRKELYDQLYTEEERTAVKAKELATKFKELNLAVPDSTTALRKLIDASSGDLKDSLLDLIPLFMELQGSIGSVGSEIGTIQEAAQGFADAAAKALDLRDAAGNLLDEIDKALGGSGDKYAKLKEQELWAALTTASYEQQIDLAGQLTNIVLERQKVEAEAAKHQLDFAKSLMEYVKKTKIEDSNANPIFDRLFLAAGDYQTTLAAARSGDEDAMSKLQSSTDDYLKLAQQYYSSSDYSSLFNSVMSNLEFISNEAETDAERQLKEAKGTNEELERLRVILTDAYAKAAEDYTKNFNLLQEQLNKLALLEGGSAAIQEILKSLPASIAGQLNAILTGIGGGTGPVDPGKGQQDKIQDYVKKLYSSVLQREGDSAGIDYWTSLFKSGGINLSQFAVGAKTELDKFKVSGSTEDYVRQLYKSVLGREGSSGDVKYWADTISKDNSSIFSFLTEAQKELEKSNFTNLDLLTTANSILSDSLTAAKSNTSQQTYYLEKTYLSQQEVVNTAQAQLYAVNTQTSSLVSVINSAAAEIVAAVKAVSIVVNNITNTYSSGGGSNFTGYTGEGLYVNGGLTGGVYPTPSAFASGGVFTNSVVSRPTRFSNSIMGEAGPEAVMPLEMVGGKLGVRAVTSSEESENDNSDIIEELENLRIEMRAVAQHSAKIARLLDRAMPDGQSIQVTQAGV